MTLLFDFSVGVGAFVKERSQIFSFFSYFVLLRITDEGSVTEMRILSILLIKCALKWSIYLSISILF